MTFSKMIGLTPTPWLPYFKPNAEARLRLFCFPYAGGGAAIYRKWSAELPRSVEVCPVQIPGRGSRSKERPFTRLMPLVEAAAQALLPYLDKPFVFFGHSMGGMMSYELAQDLRLKHGLQPLQLFVSGRRAPHIRGEFDPKTYDLPEAEFLAEVRRLNGTPKEALEHPELMELIGPLLRADFEVCQTYTYRPAPPLDCPITAFGGLQDFEVKRDHLEAWREYTTSSFLLRMLPGDHFFLNSSQALLLRVLSQELFQHVRTLS